MGPHHPSMHGVLRLIVTLDGEDVNDCEPRLGYLHRRMEKIAKNQTIIQHLPYITHIGAQTPFFYIFENEN
ncbi:NADH dehydrogenase (quinone) [Handroanthus impetiginosus]|uniref:NADH dehydrogenase (Quinone) n=1 Tax=Handroanthus impetiginosus TaxID=429701 RepID=A0A2G9G6W9_9LAMI|nr:NADH dehydrogenase (quinone) [Handroanthus impetiginosus]